MAIVSESTMYKARIAPTYVSSNGYYGYVPPCPIANYGNVVVQEQQLGGVHRADEANDQTMTFVQDWTLSSSTMLHHQNRNHHNEEKENEDVMRFNGSAMETEDDDEAFHRGDTYVGVSRCQNNHCVIPETAAHQYERGATRALYESIYRVSLPENDYDEATRRRGNRKRNSAGHPAYLIAPAQTPADNTKKSRQETVVTATLAMVSEGQENVDRPRCVMSRHH